jgi:cell division protease FtsH
MVCEWGMSELGPLTYGKKEDMVFLGRDLATHNEYSEETARKIDLEIRKIIESIYARTEDNLKKNRLKLIAIAERLLERESLSFEEIKKVIDDVKEKNVKEKKVSKKTSK